MSSRSPLSLASLMNDSTPPPPPHSHSHSSSTSTSPNAIAPLSSPQQQIPLEHHNHIHLDQQNNIYPLQQQQQQQQQQLQQSHDHLSQHLSSPTSQQQHEQEESTSLKKTQLSTSSPEGIQVASKITSTRLANLLIRKGPLPIRHITAQLALEVPSFDLLSLSKQRRLIMAAMEQPDTTNNVVFEKIGWGQWAVRKIDSDFIVTEGTESINENTTTNGNFNGSTTTTTTTGLLSNTNGHLNEKLINVNDLRNQLNIKLGWSKKKKPNTITSSRRESITNHGKSLHNIKLPDEKIDTRMISDADDDDDSEEEEDDYALSDSESSEDGLFPFDERQQQQEHFLSSLLPQTNRNSNSFHNHNHNHRRRPTSLSQRHSMSSGTPPPPPIKFARRVPIKTSPPPPVAVSGGASSAQQIQLQLQQDGFSTTRRRRSSSSAPNSITKPYRQHMFNRSRLNSLENLDNYLVSSAKNSSVLINSPPPAISFSSSPATSTTHDEHQRRKSSFNESHVRSTLSNMKSNSDETDDEDWAAIGPESLRKRKGSIPAALRDDIDSTGVNEEEKSAAFALVDLMSL